MDSLNENMPLHKKLSAFYAERIYHQKNKPVSKIGSIHKIMTRHKVSRETAKLVIKNLANLGLVSTIQGKGTYVNLRTNLVNKWAVVVPFFSSNINQFIETKSKAYHSGCISYLILYA